MGLGNGLKASKFRSSRSLASPPSAVQAVLDTIRNTTYCYDYAVFGV